MSAAHKGRTSAALTASDRAKLSALFTEYHGMLIGHLRKRGISEAVAEDAAAETWAILSRLGPDHLTGEPGGWLATVAWRNALQLLNVKRGSCIPLDDAPVAIDPNADVPTLIEQRQRISEGMAALTHLKPQQRLALTAQAVGLTYHEVGAQTGQSYTWVNRHTTEGRKALRRATAD